MADLATVADLKSDMLLSGTEHDIVLAEALDKAEAMLEGDVGDTFRAGGAVADEPHDGNAMDILYLLRPADSTVAITVKIGQLVADPDEELSSADDELRVDGRRLIRVDGGVFCGGVRNVFVTYTAEDYLPTVARAAVLECAAFLYHRIGKEHITSETIGEFGSIAVSARHDRQPAWRQAVQELRGQTPLFAT